MAEPREEGGGVAVARNEYHFVITVQGVNGDGNLVHHSVHGTVMPRRDETRQELYARLFREVCSAASLDNPTTLFFDLAPNDL